MESYTEDSHLRCFLKSGTYSEAIKMSYFFLYKWLPNIRLSISEVVPFPYKIPLLSSAFSWLQSFTQTFNNFWNDSSLIWATNDKSKN